MNGIRRGGPSPYRSQPRRAARGACVVLSLLVHAGLLAWSAYRHSPVIAEIGHLPAGLSHLEHGRFDLYRVNPPLVRLVAAVPARIVGAATDWSRYDPNPRRRSELPVGQDFLRANGRRSFRLFTLGRWACIPFPLLPTAHAGRSRWLLNVCLPCSV